MTLEELRDDLMARACNRNEQVITLVQACLDDGPKSGHDLRDTLAGLGYDRGHVRTILETTADSKVKPRQWHRIRPDIYVLHT